MEPQKMYTNEYITSEETSFTRFSAYEQGKISTPKEKSPLFLNVTLQLVLLLLSAIYYLMASPRVTFTILTNLIFINAFFFCILWLAGNKMRGGRRKLYSAINFVSTLGLFFASLIVTVDANVFGQLLVVWGIVLLSDIVIYLFARYARPITI